MIKLICAAALCLLLLSLCPYRGNEFSNGDVTRSIVPEEPPTEETQIQDNTTDVQTLPKVQQKKIENTADFTGQWKRTDVICALSAFLEIYEQTDSEFRFDITATYAANVGTLSDTAYFIAPNQAFCLLEPEYAEEQGLLLFTLMDDELYIEYDGSISALGFGHNVTAHGTYTKDMPSYLNEDIVNEVLKTQELQDRLHSLVGDSAYEQIIFIMENGFQYTNEVYTYSGFVDGIGVGVDFLIKEDGRIYCLGYGLDKPWYTFYTNDAAYKDKLPSWMPIWRNESEVSIVYQCVK